MRTHGKSRTIFAFACLCLLGLTAFLGSSAPSVGAAESFPGQGFLPDNRAWEMVSPPDKRGGEVGPASDRVHAAADGNGVAFVSLVPFGDAAGTAFDVEYVAQRDAAPETNGWSTHAVTPRRPTNIFLAPGSIYEGDFSADLSRAVYSSWRPLSDSPKVAPVVNLYLRDDLTTPGAGNYRLLSDSLTPAPTLPPPFSEVSGFVTDYLGRSSPELVDASADFEHVVFESRLGLTADTTMPDALSVLFESAQRKLYENAGGEVRSVGRIPASGPFCDDAAGPPCEAKAAESSQPGPALSGEYTEDTISRDGSRIFFQAPAGREGGKVYLREDGTRTFQLNASEKAAPDDEPQPAQLWDASEDGSRAFFTTAEQLIEEDDDGAPDLYMYDRSEPEGERLTLVSASETADDGYVETVIGASADGRSVYFASHGQLVVGEPPIDLNGLYLWHDGDLSYIGHFVGSGEAATNSPRTARAFIETSRPSRISPDGRHLLFMATRDDGFKGRGGFAGYDHGNCSGGGCRELYLYDAASAELRCASCNPAGTPATADAWSNARFGGSFTTAKPIQNLSQALSDDGRYVFFSTTEGVVPEDTNGVFDAYVYDSESEETHLLSSGEDDGGSYFMDATADGRNAFIATAERLSRWDTDDAMDIYDARVDGGLPEPKSPPPSCQGDACQPAPSRLSDPTPSSSTFKGAGNQTAARRCPRGKRRVKARSGKSRCVKRRKHKRTANDKRAANNDRRAGR